MREPALPIVAFGASTPVGRDAWSSAAAVRAGISGFAEHPYMIDTAGEPMRGAFAPWLDIDLPLQQRFEALLFPAIEQALAPLAATEPGALKLALALGLPEPRPGLPTALETELRLSLGQRYGRIFGSAATFPNGHAAGLLALQAAARVLDRGAVDACVVAGVDFLVVEIAAAIVAHTAFAICSYSILIWLASFWLPQRLGMTVSA